MTLESPSVVDQSAENVKRLETLLGDLYDGTEMSDYLSYLNPEEAKKAIDAFEVKLQKGNHPKEELAKKFKAHLEYLAA